MCKKAVDKCETWFFTLTEAFDTVSNAAPFGTFKGNARKINQKY